MHHYAHSPQTTRLHTLIPVSLIFNTIWLEVHRSTASNPPSTTTKHHDSLKSLENVGEVWSFVILHAFLLDHFVLQPKSNFNIQRFAQIVAIVEGNPAMPTLSVPHNRQLDFTFSTFSILFRHRLRPSHYAPALSIDAATLEFACILLRLFLRLSVNAKDGGGQPLESAALEYRTVLCRFFSSSELAFSTLASICLQEIILSAEQKFLSFPPTISLPLIPSLTLISSLPLTPSHPLTPSSHPSISSPHPSISSSRVPPSIIHFTTLVIENSMETSRQALPFLILTSSLFNNLPMARIIRDRKCEDVFNALQIIFRGHVLGSRKDHLPTLAAPPPCHQWIRRLFQHVTAVAWIEFVCVVEFCIDWCVKNGLCFGDASC